MSDPRRIPTTAALLGYGGLVPFVAGAIAAWAGGPWIPTAVAAFQAYGAAILAFLGGLQWGIALAPAAERFAERLAVGVLPALVAWPAVLAPPAPGITALALGLAALLAWDLRRNRQRLPAWYARLRSHLTGGALACHGIVLASLI